MLMSGGSERTSPTCISAGGQNVGKNILNFSERIAVSTVIFFGIVGSEYVVAQTSNGVPVLNVVVFSYSQASPVVVSGAEREASRIFSQSGIYLVWTNCSEAHTADSPSLCYKESAPGEIHMRLIARRLNDVFPDAVFGLAIAPKLASVYFEPAAQLTKVLGGPELNHPAILGCLMAHEIGHLLLGQNAHASSGVMQAQWNAKQVRDASMGLLGFTTKQTKLMQMNIQTRTNPR